MSTILVSLPHLSNENLYCVQRNEIFDGKKKKKNNFFSLACSVKHFVHIYIKII